MFKAERSRERQIWRIEALKRIVRDIILMAVLGLAIGLYVGKWEGLATAIVGFVSIRTATRKYASRTNGANHENKKTT